MVIPSLDVSNGKQTIIEKQTLNPENKTNNNHPQQPLEKMFRDFFRNNQDSSNKRAPNTYISPHKLNYRDQSQSPYRKYSSRRNSSSHDIYDSQNTNRMHNTNTTSPNTNRYYNEHYSRNPRNSSRPVSPHRNTSNSQSQSSYKRNQLPTTNLIADNLEVLQTASLDNTMTDEHFLDYCNYFDVGIIETITILDGTPETGSSWYIPLNVSLKNNSKNQKQIFLK